jgi:O-antigen/teichoic acid export membrane protein
MSAVVGSRRWPGISALLGRVGRSRAVLQKGGLGVADQGLISLASFVTMVLLARGLSPEAFGSFTLVYGALLFAGSIQSALITQPHAVLAANRTGQEYRRFTGLLVIGQVVLALVGAGLVALVGLAAEIVAPAWAGLLLALVPSVVAVQLQELGRRVLYTEGRLGAAFASDLCSYGGLVLVVLALWSLDQLSPEVALLAQAITATLGAAVGAWQLRRSVAWSLDRNDLAQVWQFGRWLLGAEIVGNWIATQAHLFISAAVLGPAAAGILRAAQVLFGPLRIIAYSLGALLPISFARTLGQDGPAGLDAALRRAYQFVVPLLAGYCLLVAVLAGPLLNLAYGPAYADQTTVLVLASGYYFASYLTVVMQAALRAKQLTRAIFVNDACTSLVAVPLAWICSSALGVEGSVLGMILTAVLASVLLWSSYRRGSVPPQPAASRVPEPAERPAPARPTGVALPDLAAVEVAPATGGAR